MKHVLAVCFCLFAPVVAAEPHQYILDVERSKVNLTYSLNTAKLPAQMPVKSADLLIDIDNISASQIAVTLNADGARAGFILATDAMKSAQVLDTKRFPDIHFQSSSITGDLNGALLTGALTIRGQTRPVTLNAQLFRQQDTEVGDRDNLLILLTGSISRSAFGASGYPKLVGDMIDLRVLASISK